MEEIKKDLGKLVMDVEKYVLEEGKSYLCEPLRGRFEIIRDKLDKYDDWAKRKIQEDIDFVKSVLY
jgi:hypothetical protein